MSAVDLLAGLKVHQIRVSYSDLRLFTWRNDESIEVILEGPCFVTLPDGSEHQVERSDVQSISPLLTLQSRTFAEVSAGEGTLRAVFDDGSVLAVPPLDEYEAWQIEGPADALVVCMPGGELAVFG